jgi:hypothetical protein
MRNILVAILLCSLNDAAKVLVLPNKGSAVHFNCNKDSIARYDPETGILQNHRGLIRTNTVNVTHNDKSIIVNLADNEECTILCRLCTIDTRSYDEPSYFVTCTTNFMGHTTCRGWSWVCDYQIYATNYAQCFDDDDD